MATKIGSLFGEVLLDTRKMERSLKRAQRKLTRFGRNASAAGKSLAVGFGAPLAGMSVLAIKTFADFEQEMAKVKAVSGATNEEFARLTKLAEHLGTTTRFTASEVAGLQLNFSKLGITADEIEKVTEATLDLALASGSDLAESATVAASTMRGFNLDASEMTRITDVMAMSFSSSALDLEKFSVSMATAQTAANVSGKSIEETTAILAVLINRGIEASTAGTHLRRMFSDLNEKGMDLTEGIELVAGATDKLGMANELVGKRAGASLVALSQSTESIKILTDAFENSEGVARMMAITMDDTLQGSLFRLKSAVQGTAISFMKAGGKGSSLQEFIDKIAILITDNKELIIEFATLIGKIMLIATVAGGALMVLGQLSLTLASMIGILISVVMAWKSFIIGVKAAVIALKTFTLTAGLANMVAFGKAIIATTIGFGIFKGVLEEIKGEDVSWTEAIGEGIQAIIEGLAELIPMTTKAINALAEFGSTVADVFINTKSEKALRREIKAKRAEVDALFPKGLTTSSRIEAMYKTLGNKKAQLFFDSYSSAMKSLLFNDDETARIESDKFFKLAEEIKLNMQGIVVPDGISGAAKTIGEASEEIKEVKKETFDLAGMFSGVSEALKEAGIDLDGFTGGFEQLKSLFNDIDLGDMQGELDALMTQLDERLKAAGEGVDQVTVKTATLGDKMRKSMETIGGAFEAFLADDMFQFKNQASAMIDSLSENMTDGFMKFFEEGKAGLDDFVGNFLKQMQRMVIQSKIVNPLLEAGMGFVGGLFGTGKAPEIEGKARGGSVTANTPYIVGERGMELFVPNTSGKIVPNNALGGDPVVVNFHVDAVDAQSFDSMMMQRENMIVGMIDQAFHRRGRAGING